MSSTTTWEVESMLYVCFSFVVYKDMKEAMQKHCEVDVMVNFASLRSAYDATIEALNFEQVCSNIELILYIFSV